MRTEAGGFTMARRFSVTAPPLVNPIEPGVAAVPGRPGTGIDPAPLRAGYDARSYPLEQDVLVTTLPIGGQSSKKYFVGGRRWRVLGGDLSPSGKLHFAQTGESFWVEGLRGDWSGGIESDVIFITPRTVPEGEKRADGYIVNCHFAGIHGTNRAHSKPTAIRTVTIANGRATVVFAEPHRLQGSADAATPWTVLALRQSPNQLLNRTWPLLSIDDDTTVTVRAAASPGTYPGGIGYAQSRRGGLHADGFQNDINGGSGTIVFDTVTYARNGYDAIIAGQHNQTGAGTAHVVLNRVDIGPSDDPVQDDENTQLYLADTDESVGPFGRSNGRRGNADLKEVYLQAPPGHQLIHRVYPAANTHRDGTAVGALATVVAGRRAVTWPPASGIRGVVLEGAPPGGHFCAWDSVGPNYEASADHGERDDAVPTRIRLAARPVEADAARYDLIGWLDVEGAPAGHVVDVILVDDAGGRLAVRGAQLVRGPTPFERNGGGVTVMARATVRDTGRFLDQRLGITIEPAKPEAAYRQWHERVAAAGYRPSPDEAGALRAFVAGLERDGIWDGLVALCLFGSWGPSTARRRIAAFNLRSPSYALLLADAAPIDRDGALAFAGEGHAVRTGFSPASAGSAVRADDFTTGAIVPSSRPAGAVLRVGDGPFAVEVRPGNGLFGDGRDELHIAYRTGPEPGTVATSSWDGDAQTIEGHGGARLHLAFWGAAMTMLQCNMLMERWRSLRRSLGKQTVA